MRLSLQASTAAEKDEFVKKYKSFNLEYKKKDALIREQKKLIDERNKFIKSLEERVKTLEKRYENETVCNENLTKQLKSQLDMQASQIANLTFQLHNLTKLKTFQSNNELHNATNSLKSNDSSAVVSNTNTCNLESSRTFEAKKNSTKSRKESYDNPLTVSNTNLTLAETASNQANNNSLLFTHNKNSMKHSKSLKESSRRLSVESVSQLGQNHQENEDLVLDLAQQESLLVFEDGKLVSASNLNLLAERPPKSSLRSNSARSDRSLSSPKILPPTSNNKADIIPPPDPKPFLQSSASQLHNRSKKENIAQRRTLISLPPLKPYEINQLAVECPHNSLYKKNSSNLIKSDKNKDSN